MVQNSSNAQLVEGRYADGYGRPDRGRRYYIVECHTCHVALNSGHHYREDERHHAEALAARHTCAVRTDAEAGR